MARRKGKIRSTRRIKHSQDFTDDTGHNAAGRDAQTAVDEDSDVRHKSYYPSNDVVLPPDAPPELSVALKILNISFCRFHAGKISAGLGLLHDKDEPISWQTLKRTFDIVHPETFLGKDEATSQAGIHLAMRILEDEKIRDTFGYSLRDLSRVMRQYGCSMCFFDHFEHGENALLAELAADYHVHPDVIDFDNTGNIGKHVRECLSFLVRIRVAIETEQSRFALTDEFITVWHQCLLARRSKQSDHPDDKSYSDPPAHILHRTDMMALSANNKQNPIGRTLLLECIVLIGVLRNHAVPTIGGLSAGTGNSKMRWH